MRIGNFLELCSSALGFVSWAVVLCFLVLGSRESLSLPELCRQSDFVFSQNMFYCNSQCKMACLLCVCANI